MQDNIFLAWNTIFNDTENFLFLTFWRWEISSFTIQKIDGKIILTWYFWAFHDIPGFGKYNFWCSVITDVKANILFLFIWYDPFLKIEFA